MLSYLHKEAKYLYSEKDKAMMKEIKDDTIRWRDIGMFSFLTLPKVTDKVQNRRR